MRKVNELREMSKPEVLSYIRGILDAGRRVRFEMSGYNYENSESGFNLEKDVCVSVYNQRIIDRFAFLGIYDYFVFLHIDFYKGIGELYFRLWGDSHNIGSCDEDDFGGWSTADIICYIFELSILSNNKTRRRD